MTSGVARRSWWSRSRFGSRFGPRARPRSSAQGEVREIPEGVALLELPDLEEAVDRHLGEGLPGPADAGHENFEGIDHRGPSDPDVLDQG